MNTQSLMAEFLQFLRRRGLRMTAARRDILQHIFAAHTHFEADDLHIRLRDAGHRVSKATIYRTLALFVDAGILRQSIAPSGATSTFYELVHGLDEPHEHLQCEDCGQIIEVTEAELLGYLRKVAHAMGFSLTDHTVKLVGRCEELRRAGHCSRSGRTLERGSRADGGSA